MLQITTYFITYILTRDGAVIQSNNTIIKKALADCVDVIEVPFLQIAASTISHTLKETTASSYV